MNHRMTPVAAGLLLAVSGAFAHTAPTAAIVQNGVGNQSYVEQYQAGEGASVSVVQTGNNNIIGDPVSGTGGILQHNTRNMTVAVAQLGEANQFSMRHIEGGFGGQAFINQAGTGNAANLREDGAYDSLFRIEQLGQRNLINDYATDVAGTLHVQQYGSDNVVTASRNQAYISGTTVYQDGIDNRAIVAQNDTGYTSLDIYQTGTGNEARVTQTGTNFSVAASIIQEGSGNLAVSNGSGTFNSADIRQNGLGNTAVVSQSLTDNTANVSQFGNFNTASVTQAGLTGNTNVAWIAQTGDGFAASITQSGDANRAGIYQH